MSATDSDADSEEETHVVDCGHEVPPSKTVSIPEVVMCEECYRPFDVVEWPEEIGKYEYQVVEARGTSKVTNTTYLLGLDRRGRAVYYDGDDQRVRTFVPKNNTNYSQDRHERLEGLNQDTLRPRTKERRLPGAAPPTKESYVTLPNGDHIVEVETSDKIKSHDLGEWIQEHSAEWQQVLPDVVDRYGVKGFGNTSGKPLEDYECGECDFSLSSVDPEDYRNCPECGSYKFYPAKTEDEE